MKKNRFILIVAIFLFIVGVVGCGAPQLKPTSTPNPSLITTWAPEPQQPQIDACSAAGNKVDILTKNYGTWWGYYAFKCDCKEGSSFGNGWKCGVWYPWPLEPPWISNTPLTTLVGTLEPLATETPTP